MSFLILFVSNFNHVLNCEYSLFHHLSIRIYRNVSLSFLSFSPLNTADAAAAVLGGPASPLAVQVSDVNKDYVFLTWQPPSADGASPVDGYYVEK